MLWNDAYSTGHPKIDRQHKQLFETVEELLVSDATCEDKDIITNTLLFLMGYAMNHFYTEEDIMRKCEFSQYAEHKEKHDKFIDAVAGLVKEYNTTDLASLDTPLREFVIAWLRDHVTGDDKVMAEEYLEWKKINNGDSN